MAKVKEEKDMAPSDALEIIELASDDIELLARAFNLISEVCQESDEPQIDLEDAFSNLRVH